MNVQRLTFHLQYGASLRKQVKKMEITQHAKYVCTFCGVRYPRRVDAGLALTIDTEDNRQAKCDRYLELQVLQEGHRWWRLHSLVSTGTLRRQPRQQERVN